jgi:hypothetical protein
MLEHLRQVPSSARRRLVEARSASSSGGNADRRRTRPRHGTRMPMIWPAAGSRLRRRNRYALRARPAAHHDLLEAVACRPVIVAVVAVSAVDDTTAAASRRAPAVPPAARWPCRPPVVRRSSRHGVRRARTTGLQALRFEPDIELVKARASGIRTMKFSLACLTSPSLPLSLPLPRTVEAVGR